MEIRKPLMGAGILLAYPIAYAYLKYFFLDFSDENVVLKKTLFVLAFIILNELIIRGRGKTPAKSTYFWYGIMGIVAMTYTTGLSEFVSFIGLHLCAFYVAAVSNGILVEGKTGSYIAEDIFGSTVIKAFSGFVNIFIDIGKVFTHKKKPVSDVQEVKPAAASAPVKKGSAAGVVGGIIILIVLFPVFLIVLGLLCEINPMFNDALSKLFDSLFDLIRFDFNPRWLINNIGYIIFAVPTSLYLYGMLSQSAESNGEMEKKTYKTIAEFRTICRKVSPIASCIATGMFVVLYLIFFIFEAKYMFSAFSGYLPEQFTAAEYARRGFFELTGVMFINMLIYVLITYFENRELKGRKASVALMVALMGESVVFAAVSFSKLALYYSRFGYTPKRLLAIWGTLIFAAGAIMVIVSVLKRKDMARGWIFFTTVSFALMSILSTILYFAVGGVE